jgi:serine protease Do
LVFSAGYFVPAEAQPPEPPEPTKSYAYIGVAMAPVTGGVIQRYGLPEGRRLGVLVRQVLPGGPADRAGLRPGDIIHAVDGTKLRLPHELLEAIAYRPVGSDVVLDVTRPKPGTRELDAIQVRLTLVQRTDGVDVDEAIERLKNPNAFRPARTPEPVREDPLSIGGLSLGPAAENGEMQGLRVFSVAPNSEAAMAGFFQGDRILDIDGRAVNTRRELVRALQAFPDGERAVSVRFVRDGRKRETLWTLNLPLPTPTPEPTETFVYDPTNGTLSESGGIWRVKQ